MQRAKDTNKSNKLVNEKSISNIAKPRTQFFIHLTLCPTLTLVDIQMFEERMGIALIHKSDKCDLDSEKAIYLVRKLTLQVIWQ